MEKSQKEKSKIEILSEQFEAYKEKAEVKEKVLRDEVDRLSTIIKHLKGEMYKPFYIKIFKRIWRN